MRIEPGDTGELGAEAGERARCSAAVSGENYRKSAGLPCIANRGGEHPHQLEAGLDLGVPRARRELGDAGANGVTVLTKRALQSGIEKSFRSSAHSGAAIAGIIGNGKELDLHARINYTRTSIEASSWPLSPSPRTLSRRPA